MPSIRLLFAALLIASSVDAGMVYRFTMKSAGGHGHPASGRVWIDGDRKRVELDSDPSEPMPNDVTIIAGGKTTYLNRQNNTYFHDDGTAGPSSRLFHLPMVDEDRLKGQPNVAFTDAGPGPALAGHATEWHVIDVAYRVKGSFQGSGLQADVNATIVVLVAPSLPREPGSLSVRTGFAEIDDQLAAFFGSLEGMIVSHELTVSRRLEGAAIWSEKTSWSIEELKTADVDESRFVVPRGFKYQEPIITAPGSPIQ